MTKKNLFTFLIIISFNIIYIFSGYYGWSFQLSINSLLLIISFGILKDKEIIYKTLLLVMPLIYLIINLYNKNYHTLLIAVTPFIFFICDTLINKLFKINVVYYYFYGVIIATLSYYVSEKWFDYRLNNKNDDFIGFDFPNFIYVDKSGVQSVNLNSNNDTIYVLDCWTSNCGICFKKFPDFDKIQSNYTKSKIQFYTLNLPLKRDSFDKLVSLLSNSYTKENCLFALSVNDIDRLNIRAVPHYIIVKNNKILFNGNIDVLPRNFRHDLCDEIDKYLE